MSKYKKKPIVVEAVRLTKENWREVCEFVEGFISKNSPRINPDNPPRPISLIIPTLEGNMMANEGDYIIKGTAGEIYPCKADIFDKIYVLWK